MNNTAIEIKELTKVYQEGKQERIVLNKVTETYYQGEIIILLGQSGSGKSTLLNLIGGIDFPTSGDITVDSLSLTNTSEYKRSLYRRKKIGFVFQFFNLIPTLTVLENLVLPLELNNRLTDNELKLGSSLLEEVGLFNREKSFPDQLSGGEQQRLAIARALIHDPDIILADEPTGNLDYETGKQVIGLLDRMIKKRDKTMILATHNQELTSLGNRVQKLKKGKLVTL